MRGSTTCEMFLWTFTWWIFTWCLSFRCWTRRTELVDDPVVDRLCYRLSLTGLKGINEVIVNLDRRVYWNNIARGHPLLLPSALYQLEWRKKETKIYVVVFFSQ